LRRAVRAQRLDGLTRGRGLRLRPRVNACRFALRHPGDPTARTGSPREHKATANPRRECSSAGSD
jgi:hypothetical protein